MFRVHRSAFRNYPPVPRTPYDGAMKKLFALCFLIAAAALAKDASDTFSGLELRGIGPAMVGGRIVDIAVDPRDHSTWFVAAAAGGVWKTTNAGTTFTPVFDDQASFSIGCVTIDPNDSLTIWVGSGENNSQRAVNWGDGVYKSVDGGKSFTNVGLPASEHIGKIVVDPRDSKVVYVAAQGPLWSPGGDRGLYKTTDGGKTWKRVLNISENTGVTDVVLDPSDPDTLYAAAYQRRRHVYAMINGGPESAIHKSTDGGATWTKLSKGLPKEWMGRIGLAIPRQEPKTVYAIIEATRRDGGFFRSKDGGATFEKMSPYAGGGAQYYAEIFVDPNDAERLYAMDVYARTSDDGGKTWRRIGEKFKHVDNHAVWIDPSNSNHILFGCDGGLYETFDRTATWNFKSNLPLAQFYRISADDALPFYNVYGGTQDNFALGGPSRTTTAHGIVNSDWYTTHRRRRLPHDARSDRPQRHLRRVADTECWVVTTSARAKCSTSSRRPARGWIHCARTGIRRSSSVRTMASASISPRSICSAAMTAAIPGSRSAATSRATSIAIRCR